MIRSALEELRENPEWVLVLEAYMAASLQAKQLNPEQGTWLVRIHSIEGVADERIPQIHGKLIALDFLRFQLASRTSGVLYDVSPRGREALARLRGDVLPDDFESYELAESA